MSKILFPPEEFTKIKKELILYGCALKATLSKIDILYEDYKSFHDYNPIEHIKSRIKSPESIAEKLYKKGYELTANNAVKRLDDIAGARIICSFSKDIYEVAETLKRQSDINCIRECDYIAQPKESGYRSYHLIISLPIFLVSGTRRIKVEIQLRTEAMDFWASLEHKVRYKYNGNIPGHLSDELKTCADKINELDERMFLIHDILQLINTESGGK